ncbi:MAG TPA: hypothetical protein VFP10_10685 [Candidatus Eisenbacteria bacterium]|nr:hypothetical protein [Candidatus Eisenbacteria bacterium]
MNITVRRPVAALLVFTLLCACGCAGTTKLDREDLAAPPEAETYRVSMRDGRNLDFIALHMEEDWLVGTVRHTSAESTGEGDASRSSVTNRYEEVRVPWSDVTLVEADTGRGGPSGLLLAGGAIVAGAVAFLLLSQSGDDNPDTGGGGGGK